MVYVNYNNSQEVKLDPQVKDVTVVVPDFAFTGMSQTDRLEAILTQWRSYYSLDELEALGPVEVSASLDEYWSIVKFKFREYPKMHISISKVDSFLE